MKLAITLTLAVLSTLTVASQAADNNQTGLNTKSSATGKSVCKKGEVGGIVASNKKLNDGGYTTVYVGDKIPFNTPADAKDAIAKISKLKAGDTNCMVDDGS